MITDEYDEPALLQSSEDAVLHERFSDKKFAQITQQVNPEITRIARASDYATLKAQETISVMTAVDLIDDKKFAPNEKCAVVNCPKEKLAEFLDHDGGRWGGMSGW